MTIEFRPLKNIGAEVVGLDISSAGEAVRAEVYSAWLDYGVLLFRQMGESAEVQVTLTQWFGGLLLNEDNHALKSTSVTGSKELIEVSRAGTPMAPSYYINDRLTSGFIFWHQDLVYTPSICKGSLLRMIKTPEEGGQTGWIDTQKVYEALPDATKARIEGMEIRHRLRKDLTGVPFGLPQSVREASMEEAPYKVPHFPELPDVVHPLVQIHPETGRRSLGISPLGLVEVVGLPRDESDALLRELVEFTLEPQFMLIHQWTVNDMVVWDNRRTVHSVLGHPYGQDRVAHRTTLAGTMNSGRYYEEAAMA